MSMEGKLEEAGGAHDVFYRGIFFNHKNNTTLFGGGIIFYH